MFFTHYRLLTLNILSARAGTAISACSNAASACVSISRLVCLLVVMKIFQFVSH